MPRLAVDEPEQLGKATGPPPRPKAERTAPAPKRKRASPKTTAQPERKRPSYPSPNKQAQLAALHLQAQAKPKKERAKAAKALAKEYNVGPQYPRQVAKKVIAKKKLATRKGVGGQNQRITAEDELMIRATLKEHAYELTFRQLEEKTGIAKSTLQRFMRKHKWRQVAKGTRQHLTEGNISGRLLWAQENEKNDWWDHVRTWTRNGSTFGQSASRHRETGTATSWDQRSRSSRRSRTRPAPTGTIWASTTRWIHGCQATGTSI